MISELVFVNDNNQSFMVYIFWDPWLIDRDNSIPIFP